MIIVPVIAPNLPTSENDPTGPMIKLNIRTHYNESRVPWYRYSRFSATIPIDPKPTLDEYG
jgi:hypothetical protein